MYKQAFILSLALFTPSTGSASVLGKHNQRLSTQAATTRGSVLAQRMAAALERQTHIEARGHLDGPGAQSVQYLVRYQANGREYMHETGGVWNQVQVGHKRLQGLQIIAVAKTVFSSTDGKHWLRAARLAPPSALDAISINPAMAPCCLPGKTANSQVTNMGQKSSRFGRVYALNYRATSINASIKGTLLVDSHSFLPREYTENCQSLSLKGTFVLTYGGSFSIKAPAR
jgi:hypothetical protein